MAITAAGTNLTRKHRRTQAAIRTVTLRQVLALWPLLDVTRLDETAPGWVEATTRTIVGGRALSARAAAAYYAAFRAVEGVGGTAPSLVAPTAPLEAIRTSLIVTGPVALKKATANGVPLARSTADALTQVSGAAGRHIADGGRDTLIGATRRDRRAQGWARVVSGDGCAFCQMLASRGPVYKSQDTGGFEAHDHCGCDVEPAFDGDYQWPETSVAARELWDALPAKSLVEYRRALASA